MKDNKRRTVCLNGTSDRWRKSKFIYVIYIYLRANYKQEYIKILKLKIIFFLFTLSVSILHFDSVMFGFRIIKN
jgi:hypothetical protein